MNCIFSCMTQVLLSQAGLTNSTLYFVLLINMEHMQNTWLKQKNHTPGLTAKNIHFTQFYSTSSIFSIVHVSLTCLYCRHMSNVWSYELISNHKDRAQVGFWVPWNSSQIWFCVFKVGTLGPSLWQKGQLTHPGHHINRHSNLWTESE